MYTFKLSCNNFPINLSIHIFAILAGDVISNFGKLFWISISRKIFYLLTSLARRRPPFFSTIIRPSVTKFLPISSLFEASETVTNSRVPILYSVLILTCRSRTSSLRALSPEAAYSSCFYEKKKKWKKCLFCMYSFFRENYLLIIGTKRSFSPWNWFAQYLHLEAMLKRPTHILWRSLEDQWTTMGELHILLWEWFLKN